MFVFGNLILFFSAKYGFGLVYDRYPLFQVSADTDISAKNRYIGTDISADILFNKKSTFSKHKFRIIFLSMKSVMILMIILITLISNCIAIIFVQNEIKFTFILSKLL